MSSKTTILESTSDYYNKAKRLKDKIQTADAIVIGAGAGLSASAGFTYSDRRFQEIFPDFIKKYGFHDMYFAGFYPFPTLEEHWAYWSRYILANRYQSIPKPVYDNLLLVMLGKNYFVLTTNVDHCFQKTGFDKQRIAPDLVPLCPICGTPMSMNLRADTSFAEDVGWRKAAGRYRDFLRRHTGQHILYLELGVGSNTPGIIKFPFWQMTYQNPNAVYACINYGAAAAPQEIKTQSICINADIDTLLEYLQ